MALLIQGDDILDDGVNIAARLEGIAKAGGICISSSAYEQVRGKVVAVEFTDLGEQSLKNIARPGQSNAAVQDELFSETHSGGTIPITPSAPRMSMVVFLFRILAAVPSRTILSRA